MRLLPSIQPTLRSLDALHLATALSVRDEIGVFVTYDQRLAEAAADSETEGGAASVTEALGLTGYLGLRWNQPWNPSFGEMKSKFRGSRYARAVPMREV